MLAFLYLCIWESRCGWCCDWDLELGIPMAFKLSAGSFMWKLCALAICMLWRSNGPCLIRHMRGLVRICQRPRPESRPKAPFCWDLVVALWPACSLFVPCQMSRAGAGRKLFQAKGGQTTRNEAAFHASFAHFGQSGATSLPALVLP